MFDWSRFMYSTNFRFVPTEGCGGVLLVGVEVVGVVAGEAAGGFGLGAAD